VIPTATNATGQATMVLGMPPIPGGPVHVQWVNRDPAANPFGFTTSETGAIKVGT